MTDVDYSKLIKIAYELWKENPRDKATVHMFDLVLMGAVVEELKRNDMVIA